MIFLANSNSKEIELPKDPTFDELERYSREIYQQGIADALSIDMDKPMHFTDEQKAWIKNYIIINAKRHRADAIEEFADTMQLVKLVECEDVPRELIEAIEKQIGICALRVKEKMLKE